MGLTEMDNIRLQWLNEPYNGNTYTGRSGKDSACVDTYKEFRRDWNSYLDENIENLYNS